MIDRVDFQVRDAADSGLAGRYDFVTVFEAVHDMARPVEALRAIRRLLAEGGVALVADERVADEFGARRRRGAGDVRLVDPPLPSRRSGRAALGGAGQMRESTFRRYAEEAGFTDIQVVPIEHDFWRFYRLQP